MQIHALMLMGGGSKILGANVNAQSFSKTELFATSHADLTGANVNAQSFSRTEVFRTLLADLTGRISASDILMSTAIGCGFSFVFKQKHQIK